MSVYLRVYADAADGAGTTSPNASYATARASTTAFAAGSAFATIGQSWSGSVYQVFQYLGVFDTSSISLSTATLSLNVSTAASTLSDSVEVRAVSGITNMVAGADLASKTPLYGSWAITAGSGRKNITLDNISAMPHASGTQMLFHSLNQRANTAPTTTTERIEISTADTSGTTSDPYLETVGGWSIVGVGTVVEAATTAITLTEPAGVADGDLLIACFASRSTAITPVTNTGWTAVASQNNNNVSATAGSAAGSGTMLYQVRAGTPDLSFVVPAGISVIRGQIVAYRGNATTTPGPATPLAPTSNNRGVSTSTPTYSVAREATNATVTPSATMSVGQFLSGGNYFCNQYFMTFDTSTVSASATTADLSMVYGNAGTVAGDTLEVREVPSAANMIAGSSLSSYPLLGSLATPITATTQVFNIPLNISAMTRGSAVVLCVHSQNQRLNTAPTASITDVLVNTLAAAAAIRPQMTFGSVAATTPVVTAVSVTGLTTTQDDDLIVALAAGGQEATWSGFTNATTPLTASGATDTTTTPSTTAWIERAESITTTGADTSIGIFDAVRTTTGATGNLTVTASIASGHVVVAGAFKIQPPDRPLFRNSVNTTYTSRTNTTLTLSGAIAVNDILLAGIFTGANPSAPTVTPPAGFTALSGSPSSITDGGGFNGKFHLFWKRAASETGTYTFTHSAASSQGVLLAISGAETSISPIDASSSNTGINNVATATGVTTTVANDLLVWLSHDWTGGGALSPPSGFTEWFDGLVYAAVATQTSTGASGDKTQTNGNGTGGTDRWGAWLVAVKGRSAGPTAYTLPAVAGTYALTGTAASLERGREVEALSGSYALTGTDATLTKGAAVIRYDLPAAAGSYALSGATAGLYRGREVLAVAGTYAVSGATASLEVGREIAADAGSYALTGAAASLESGKEVLALGGFYASTGTTATLRHDYKPVAVSGAYSLTGTPANLLRVGARAIIGLPGSYTLTGADAGLVKATNRVVAAVSGSYSLTGTATSLELGREILALGGSYAVTGATANLERGREVDAVQGSYVLTGTAATFRHTWKTGAVGGSYALTGAAATFARTWKAAAVAGAYALTGLPVNLLKPGAWAIIGLPGAYALTGTAASLEIGREVLALGGSYTLSGTATSLEKGREVLALAGSYALTGVAATLSKIGAGTVLAGEAGSYTLTGSPVSLVWSGEVVVTPPGGGGMPWYGRPSGIPKKQLRKAVRELLAREEKRKKRRKPRQIAREILAVIEPQGLGIAEKRIVSRLISQALVSELPQMFYSQPLIHDKGELARAILFIIERAMQRLLDDEEDEEAALLLLSAA